MRARGGRDTFPIGRAAPVSQTKSEIVGIVPKKVAGLVRTGAGATQGLICIADTDGAAPTVDRVINVDPAHKTTRIAESALELDSANLDFDGPPEDVHFADVTEIDIEEKPRTVNDL